MKGTRQTHVVNQADQQIVGDSWFNWCPAYGALFSSILPRESFLKRPTYSDLFPSTLPWENIWETLAKANDALKHSYDSNVKR